MGKFSTPEEVIYICTGSKCGKKGGKAMYKLLKSYLKHAKTIEVIRTDCTDRCKFAPVLCFQPQNVWLKEYSEREVLQLLERFMQKK